MLEPFNVMARIPQAMAADKAGRPDRTNAKHSGETLQRNPPEFLARQGKCFMFPEREPMMPLCRNGLTRIKGC
jgi:hypothetical protein